MAVAVVPEAITRYFSGVNNEDWDDFRGIWHDDADVDVVGGMRFRGVDEIMAYYPRALPHGELLLEAAGLSEAATPAMLTELTNVFTLLTYLWYRARRVARNVPATDLQLETAALRRLLSLAPDAQPRHTSAANLRESSGFGKRNGDAAGD